MKENKQGNVSKNYFLSGCYLVGLKKLFLVKLNVMENESVYFCKVLFTCLNIERCLLQRWKYFCVQVQASNSEHQNCICRPQSRDSGNDFRFPTLHRILFVFV